MIQRGEAVASGFLFGALLQIASLLGGLTAVSFAEPSVAPTSGFDGVVDARNPQRRRPCPDQHTSDEHLVCASRMCVLGPLLVSQPSVAQLLKPKSKPQLSAGPLELSD